MKTKLINSILERRKRVLDSYKNQLINEGEDYTEEQVKNINARVSEIEGFVEDLEYILKYQ